MSEGDRAAAEGVEWFERVPDVREGAHPSPRGQGTGVAAAIPACHMPQPKQRCQFEASWPLIVSSYALGGSCLP